MGSPYNRYRFAELCTRLESLSVVILLRQSVESTAALLYAASIVRSCCGAIIDYVLIICRFTYIYTVTVNYTLYNRRLGVIV